MKKTKLSSMENDAKIDAIREWIKQYHDRVSYIENPVGAYSPSNHPNGLQFFFNPPFNEYGESVPEVSGMLAVEANGEVWVSDYLGIWYKLVDCPPISIDKIYGALIQ